jgi:elongation factor P
MAIDTSQFNNGLIIEVEGEICTVVWFQHHKPGKGGAVMRTKLRNLKTGATIERTFKSGEKFREVEMEKRKKEYMYNDGKNYYFMDSETYEQVPIPKEQLGEAAKFLKENTGVEELYLDGKYYGIDMPANVDLKVTSTEPGVRGDTVTNVLKPAILETGAEIRVPLFIKTGDVVKIDTRSGEYIERVN